MTARLSRTLRALGSERGFTMIVAIGVMFVTGLLLVAAFTLAQGETDASRNDLQRKQAYYASLAGVQEYEYQLQANPDYWEKCGGPASTVAGENNERYEVEVMKATSAPAEFKTCTAASPFQSAIESKGSFANTFRIKSVGYAGTAKRTLIATFKVTGFLDYIYFTNFETLDPTLYAEGKNCKGLYYEKWNGKYSCVSIIFTSGDSVEGPMHTNDSTRVEGSAEFGRAGHTPADAVEIYGGTYPEDSGFNCKAGSAIFNTENKCYVKGERLQMPESDTSLASYVEPKYEYKGETRIVLNGGTNTFNVTHYEKGTEVTENNVAMPKNGLIYVTQTAACSYPYEPHGADNKEEIKQRENCADVYVSGSYSESLTIAAEDNLIINGNVYPKSVEGKLGSAPTGTATLGLIATNFVRVYHPVGKTYNSPCKGSDKSLGGGKCEYTNTESGGCDAPNLSAAEDPNGWGTFNSIWVYAAILSTAHSFITDNWNCGSKLEELHEYGAIAQDYRGPVGTSGGTGYIKDYKYDDRLATDEPPYFLAPLKAGWKVIRETAPSNG
jgi:hypothetical protein